MPEIVDRFDAIVDASPEALAVAAADGMFTFEALRARSRRLASDLRRSGVVPGDVVALACGSTAAHVVGMLATWRLSAAFLPLDPAAPARRVEAIKVESRARAQVGPELAISAALREPEPLGLPSDDLAYVIYTSGSTGRPKGVRISHRGLVPMLLQQVEAFGLQPGKRATLLLSTAFDASISDIGTALLSGATLVIPPRPPAPRDLTAFLAVRGITHADLPPSILPLVDPAALPGCLDTIVIGGEVCPPAAVRAWAERVRVVNVYGPTEATICTSLGVCDAGTWDRPRLGAPLEHVEYRVEEGELLIAGDALALGYVDRPELEAARFVVRGGRRYYRTGDLVRGPTVHDLEIVGRLDRQVKVRGRLVSPEEVEAALLSADGVVEAAVVPAPPRDGGAIEALTAHVVLRDGATTDVAALHEHLSGMLPAWMIPRILLGGALTRGASGKVDLPRLRAAHDSRTELIAAAFAEVLGRPHVHAEDDFLALGGDSLAAFEVATVAQISGVTIEATAVLAARTPAAIARTDVATARRVDELETLAARSSLRLGDSPPQSRNGEDWLVTGAAGFLGRRVVAGLLARTDATLHCLVRPHRAADAARRLGPSSRIVVHEGDVASPHFGLPRARWEALAASVGHVLHAAATVNLALPFETLAPGHIDGALEVARFVRTGGAKSLAHVSTLAVLVATDLGPSTLDERTRLETDGRVYGAYAQTKYVAERILRRAVPDALVVRPGLLTGDSTTGLSADACPLISFLRALARLGAVPRGDHARLRVDVTPVDYAAAVLVALSVAPPPAQVIHVASRSGTSLAELVAALRRRVSVVDVSADDFVRRARSELPRETALAIATATHRLLESEAQRDADLFLMTDRLLDCSLAERLTGLSCPPASDALLDRYVDVALGRAA